MAKKQEPAGNPQTGNYDEANGASSRSGSGKSGLALLALAIAVSGLLLQAWLWMSKDPADLSNALTRIQVNSQAQQADSRSLKTEIAGLSARVDQLQNRQPAAVPPDFSVEIARLQQETAHLARQSDAMQFRLNERSAVTQSNDRHMARAEIEYLLRLGNERLQLFGDRQAALTTLQLAERQLASMDDPLMLPVRRQLQQDIRAISSVKTVDLLIIMTAIQDLESSLQDWPLKQVAVKAEILPDEADTSLWGRFKQSLRSLVTISKQDEPTLTLEEIDWLQERIRAQFQVARIASLNADQELFHTALQTILQWQAEHYQADEPSNAKVRRSLQQLMATNLKPELPDITSALREMQYLGSPLQPAAESQPASVPQREPDPQPAEENAENEQETTESSE